MGNNNSKKPQQVPESNSILTNHIKNSDYNVQKTDDSINRLDQQTIQTIKRDLSENPELFVLNNMLMSVMFFENYTKFTEDLKKELLKKHIDFINPDPMLEKVSENVVYRPHHGPKKYKSEPLVPKRIFVLYDWIKVVGTTEEIEEDNKRTIVRMEESQKKGYVRLRTTNNSYQRFSGSPILSIDTTESNSRSSEDYSDNSYYVELQNLKTPKPLELIKGLEKHEQTSSSQNGLPDTCISYRKNRKTRWNDEMVEEISENDFYETVSYINSKSFMKHLENDYFFNGVVSKLGFDIENIKQLESIQEKISCIITENEKYIPYEIVPSIQISWPSEQTLKFLIKGNRTPEVGKRYIFPTNSMIDDISSLDCVLLPKGYLKKKGDKTDADIEWELAFPQAQRYLETFMSHAQTKSLLILLTLHKTYVEPKTTHYGLLTDHIRNFILGECESNFSEWPEHRLGIKLIQVIKNLTTHLSKAQPNLPDFFINDKNTLREVPTSKIRYAQKVYYEVLQAPLMHFIKALRNLRYTKGKTFFLPFDFQKLCEILEKPEFYNKRISKNIEPTNTKDMENVIELIKIRKKREAILKKRRQSEEQNTIKENVTETDERRGSLDSINVDWTCEKKFDLNKKRKLLKFFIETFLNISEKCLAISSKQNTFFYIKQAFYLTRILKDECPAFTDEAVEFLEKISNLEEKYGKKAEDIKNVNVIPKSVGFGKKTQIKGPNNFNKNKDNGQKLTRKSVTFM